jgi:hypothetical protein
MRQVKLDEKLPGILSTALQELEIVDAMGRLLGVFKPRHTLKDFEGTENWPTDEEIEAEIASGRPTFTTEQVIARLRSLG